MITRLQSPPCLRPSLAACRSRHRSILAVPATAWAYDEFPGTRALGMGGASRAFAVGDSGPMLNPSGMSLVKNFQCWRARYGYGSRLNDHTLHASTVDNTSAFGIAGGLYYTTTWPSRRRRLHRSRARGRPGAVGPGRQSRHDRRHGEVLQPVRRRRARRAAPAASRSTSGRPCGLITHARRSRSSAPTCATCTTATRRRGSRYGVALMPVRGLVIAADGWHAASRRTTTPGARGPASWRAAT